MSVQQIFELHSQHSTRCTIIISLETPNTTQHGLACWIISSSCVHCSLSLYVPLPHLTPANHSPTITMIFQIMSIVRFKMIPESYQCLSSLTNSSNTLHLLCHRQTYKETTNFFIHCCFVDFGWCHRWPVIKMSHLNPSTVCMFGISSGRGTRIKS